LPHYEAAVAQEADNVNALLNYANALLDADRSADARKQ
jgi:CRISPR/Cas system-associated endonuclease Cas1